MTSSAYTPLETLLLFQALRHEATTSSNSSTEASSNFSFNRISEQLLTVPAIHEDAAFDGGRLSPEALREQYLWLLKEEVKRDLLEKEDANATTSVDGDASPGPRKRKAPSPTMPTVQEAAKHTYLIPQLINRLYATYRDKAIREIREYERKYEALSREISDIEAGEWDERLQRQRPASATQSPKAHSSAQSGPTAPTTQPAPALQGSTGSPVPATRPEDGPASQAPPKRYSQAKIDAVINHGPEPQNGYSGHRRTSSNTPLPPISNLAGHAQPPRYAMPPNVPPGNVPPHMQQPYVQSPPNQNAQYPQQHAHPSAASPQMHPPMASSSPRPILPPPPGMTLPPPSPSQHVGSPGYAQPMPQQQHYQPQHRSSLGPAPPANQAQGYPQQLQAQGYYAPQPYQDRRTSYTQQQPQGPPPSRYPTQPPHQGGYQLQPWMVNNGQQTSPQPKHQQPLQQSRGQQTPAQPPPRKTSYPHVSVAPATAPRTVPPPQSRLISDIVSALATPPRASRRPVWKSEKRPPPVDLPEIKPAPDIEPLSPVQVRAEPVGRVQRAPRKREGATPVEVLASKPIRTRRTRGTSPHSVASSTAGDLSRTRTRSQSVATVTGTSATGPIKPEPETPADRSELPSPAPAADPSATPASRPMTRKRRGTLQTIPQPVAKRKRGGSPSLVAEGDSHGTPPPRPTTVSATRNFAKIASAIMNDIQSHKHAAYFAKPVSDKDASGYSEIIKQPQHLKSIRAAIAAGTRAVAAASSSLADSPTATADTPSGSSTTVELERTDDLQSPKAIVNAAQLEKEVYRMFANAVMFNPGEDGLVAYTREMFGDVEERMREWRGMESQAEEAGAVEEEGSKSGKRRKL